MKARGFVFAIALLVPMGSSPAQMPVSPPQPSPVGLYYQPQWAGCQGQAPGPVSTPPQQSLTPEQAVRAFSATTPPVLRLVYQPASEEPGSRRFRIQVEPPGPERVFHLESEEALQLRIAAEARTAGRLPPPFPVESPLGSQEPAMTPGREAKVVWVEPASMYYRRLMFEEKNSERYGWDLGIVQPLVSTAVFYADVATAPVRRLVSPCQSYENNASHCLPGDPVPYRVNVPVPRPFATSSEHPGQ